ncbi:MAG: hypothetical protein Q7U60_01170 [Candidatus Methanoperedens sp.]|nr:hypothetical protein [Candidatus Methanoperedens sp.]
MQTLLPPTNYKLPAPHSCADGAGCGRDRRLRGVCGKRRRF